MRKIARVGCTVGPILLVVLLGLLFAWKPRPCDGGDEWPQFRGPRASGVADQQNLPEAWDVDAGTNIRWKTRVPGLGHASPVVSRGRVFILTAESENADPELRLGLYGDIRPVPDEGPHVWSLYCLSLATGDTLWQHILHRGVPATRRHPKATHANATPATDGRYVVALLGSEGLYCLDLCGQLLWRKDLGRLDAGFFRAPEAQWGFASSPILFGDMVIVQCDVQQDSFLAAFRLQDGQQLWRTGRDDVPTWSTPTIVHGPTRIELVVNGYQHAGGYDPFTGQLLWQLGLGGDIPVPTPITADGLIFLSGAHGPNRPLCAVRAGAEGDLTDAIDTAPNDVFAWYRPRDGIYIQTPIVYGPYLYACRENGILSCYEAQTGAQVYRERIEGGRAGFSASPVAADGKLYFAREDGEIVTVAAGPEFRQLAVNSMGEPCMATPAIADGLLIVRTTHHVYAIGHPVASVAAGGPCPAFTTHRAGTWPRSRVRCWRPLLRRR